MAFTQEAWIIRKKDGQEFEVSTIGGLGPQQAVENAGFMMSEIDFIRHGSIQVVPDIAAWRRGEA